jgi:hypothetical protein
MRTLVISVSLLLTTVTSAIAADGSGSLELPQTRVTLQAEHTTLNAALAEVTKQTQISVVSKLPDNPAIESLSLKQVPFWQAVDQIAAAAHAFVESYEPVTLQPLATDQKAPLVSYSGPFRIALKRTSVSKDFFSGASTCTAVLEIAWEPGTRLFYFTYYRDKLEVRDSKNNLLKTGAGSTPDQVTEKYSREVELRLPAVPRTETELGLIAGKFMARGTPQMRTVAFPDLSKGQVLPLPDESKGNTVKLVDAEFKKDVWNVKLDLTHSEGLPHFESWQSWVFHDEIAIQPANGGPNAIKLEMVGMEIDVNLADKFVVTYRFAPPPGKKPANPKDWKLTYRTPGRLAEMPIDFSFRHIPLP